jgi:hypothetical protein
MSVRLQEWLLRRRLRRSDLKGKLEISEQQLGQAAAIARKQLKKKAYPRLSWLGQ